MEATLTVPRALSPLPQADRTVCGEQKREKHGNRKLKAVPCCLYWLILAKSDNIGKYFCSHAGFRAATPPTGLPGSLWCSVLLWDFPGERFTRRTGVFFTAHLEGPRLQPRCKQARAAAADLFLRSLIRRKPPPATAAAYIRHRAQLFFFFLEYFRGGKFWLQP